MNNYLIIAVIFTFFHTPTYATEPFDCYDNPVESHVYDCSCTTVKGWLSSAKVVRLNGFHLPVDKYPKPNHKRAIKNHLKSSRIKRRIKKLKCERPTCKYKGIKDLWYQCEDTRRS